MKNYLNSTKHDFSPEEVHELSVAHLNVCAAIEGAAPTPELKARIATEIVRMAKAGQCNATDLYLACLDYCRKQMNIAVIKGAM